MAKGMNLRQILANIPYEPDTRNARYVNVVRAWTREGEKPTAISPTKKIQHRVTTVTSIPGQRPRRHVVTIWSGEPGWHGAIANCPAIKIDCDCERHMYMWEYALNRRGAADIIRSNGQPPVDKNPNLHPACCKHGLVAFHHLLRTRAKL